MKTKNSKKSVPVSIDASLIEGLLREKGYTILEDKAPLPEGHDGNKIALVQAGFVKVQGAKGRAIYVAKTKLVNRIDISGFEYSGPGVVDLGDDSFGGVKQQLRQTDLSQEEIVANLGELIDHMLTLEPVVKATKSKKDKEAKPGATGWSFTPVASDEEKAASKAKRQALLAKVATEHGVEVSERA